MDFKTIEKDPYLERAIHEEIRILSKFKHPNVVQLLEVLNSKRSLKVAYTLEHKTGKDPQHGFLVGATIHF